MPTYHLTAWSRPGAHPNPGSCPLPPMDFTADSEADALAAARSHIAEFRDGFSGADYGEKWMLAARRVDRPAIELHPRGVASDVVRDGEVVGTTYDYGEATGTESFDILLDGVAGGRLARFVQEPGRRVWTIEDAGEVLAPLTERQWIDRSPGGDLAATLWWLHGVLADIREALEAAR